MGEIYQGNNPSKILELLRGTLPDEKEDYVPPGDSEDWHNPDVGFGQRACGGTSENPVSYDDPNHPSCGQATDRGIFYRVFGK